MVRVAVVGGINIDVLALVDRQPEDDQPSRIHTVADGVGGKGANQAVAAAALGATVRLLGAAAADVPALLDIAPAQGPLRALIPLARYLTGNRAEARAATGVDVRDEATAREAATVLRAHGPTIAGVTVGAAGQLVAWPGGEAWCEPDRRVEVVGCAGAGDAFAATLAVSLAEGCAPRQAATYASRASTYACRALGAQASLAGREDLGWS